MDDLWGGPDPLDPPPLSTPLLGTLFDTILIFEEIIRRIKNNYFRLPFTYY
jgi:hypothetical protein